MGDKYEEAAKEYWPFVFDIPVMTNDVEICALISRAFRWYEEKYLANNDPPPK